MAIDAYIPVTRSETISPTFWGTAAGFFVGIAGNGHQAGHSLEDGVVARQLAIRPGLPETGDAAVNQTRVDGRQRTVIEAMTRQVANLVVFNQHIAGLHEFANDCLTGWLGDVHGDGLLVAVGAEEEAGVTRLVALVVTQERRTEAA
jgi:hypothetical protein